MRKLIFLLAALWPVFVGAEDTKQRPNVLLICIDDLRPELKCFGVDYIHSPNIDGLAARGRAFHRHYVQSPTCGASRYTLLTGRYGSASNGALFQHFSKIKDTSFPGWFRKHGYATVSVGKVSHHPGGRGGADWNDAAKPEMPGAWTRHLLPAGPWKHPRGAMHGLANGEIRGNAKGMDLFQSFDGPDTAYPDGLITDEALKQMNTLSKGDKPFLLAVGIIRPHLPFGAPAKYMRHYQNAKLPATAHPQKPAGKTTWHGSGEFMKYNRWKRNPNTDAAFALEVRKHYAACVTYADAMVGRLLARLDELKLRDNTVIVLWGDHGWHLGEHAIWGKHALFEESLRSPLIISHPHLTARGKPTQAMVETLDIFPTVCDLAGLKPPAGLNGQSLVGILKNSNAKGHPAFAYKGGAQTIRTATHRLIAHRGGELELYDHTTPAAETQNLAKTQPEKAAALLKQLRARLK
ncbi:MAG: sulfatase [Verrucomicrobiota bacterium]|nr:sulfatase [Verrucomicrobiota bacterium]